MGILNLLTQMEILEQIIKDEGSCNNVRWSLCKECPLSKFARYNTKSNMSCSEAMKVNGLNHEETDRRYKQAAIDKLADLVIEKAITDK